MTKLAKHLYPSGLNSHFSAADAQLSYSAYIQKMRTIITSTRFDLQNENREFIIDSNAPQEFSGKNNQRGILLIHGLLDSPACLSDLTTHFRQQGYLVRTLLLPGHGTIPGDLTTVQLDDWLTASRFAINHFRGEVNKLIVAGFSTGASLALYQALQGLAIHALLLFAPAIKLKQRVLNLAPLHKLVSWAYPPAAWACIAEEDDYAKYQSIAFNAISQVTKLTRANAQLLQEKKLNVPQYLIISSDDEAVDAEAAYNYFCKYASKDSRFLLYSNDSFGNGDPRIIQVTSKNNSARILNYSHHCLTVSPQNPHYGEHGDYKDFKHYKVFLTKKYKRLDEQEIYLGSVTKYNLMHYNLQRLRFNPDFTAMMQRIDAFLNHVL